MLRGRGREKAPTYSSRDAGSVPVVFVPVEVD
jgi:hypothetical protein